jgi:hypothetical protein
MYFPAFLLFGRKLGSETKNDDRMVLGWIQTEKQTSNKVNGKLRVSSEPLCALKTKGLLRKERRFV